MASTFHAVGLSLTRRRSGQGLLLEAELRGRRFCLRPVFWEMLSRRVSATLDCVDEWRRCAAGRVDRGIVGESWRGSEGSVVSVFKHVCGLQRRAKAQ